jgi:hypothetical protein
MGDKSAQSFSTLPTREALKQLLLLLEIPPGLWFLNWTELAVIEAKDKRGRYRRVCLEASVEFREWSNRNGFKSRITDRRHKPLVKQTIRDLHSDRDVFIQVLCTVIKCFLKNVARNQPSLQNDVHRILNQLSTDFDLKDEALFLQDREKFQRFSETLSDEMIAPERKETFYRQVLNRIEITGPTLKKYLEKDGNPIKLPGVGQRDWQFTRNEVMLICHSVLKHSNNDITKANCQRYLEEL